MTIKEYEWIIIVVCTSILGNRNLPSRVSEIKSQIFSSGSNLKIFYKNKFNKLKELEII